jgi:hypothetical protein
MRILGSSLAVSALLFAAPALAQGGYYDSGSPYNRQQMNQDRFERYDYYPQQQGQMHHGPMRYGQSQQNYGQQSDQQWQMQPGSMPQGMRERMHQMHQGMHGGYPSRQMGMGQIGQSPPAPVSHSTQGQIKSSLESSGFKEVTVLPQSYLIRATAPDGSRIVMQVSSDGLYGVVVNPTDQAASSRTGTTTTGGTTTGGTSGTGSASSSTGGTSGTASTGGTSGTGGTTTGGTSGTGTASSSTGGTTTGGTSSSTGQATTR